MSKLIAIVDDEPAICELVALHLKRNGYKVKEYNSAESFLSSLTTQQPDLLILDVQLKEKDGFEVCETIKKGEYAFIPIIMLTVKNSEADRIRGFELGADDYVTKPFSPRELIFRVRSVLRRGPAAPPMPDAAPVQKNIVVNNILEIDFEKYQVFVSGKPAELTSTEFKILQLLCEKRGFVFSREQLLNYLWGGEKVVIDRTIDVHIKNLRKKLKSARKFIKNIRGIGYKFDA